MKTAVALLSSCLLAVISRPADACSAPACWSGDLVPGEGATTPANVPGLYWRPMVNGERLPERVTLETTTDPTPLPFTATALDNGDFLLVPDAPLVPGTTYKLSDGNPCSDGTGPRITFDVSAEAPLPARLGTLSVNDGGTGSLTIGTSAGSCSTEVIADRAQITIELAPEALPWKDVLHFETLVDGQRWRAIGNINDSIAPGATWTGRGRDVIYTICEAGFGASIGDALAEGTHTVQFRATLPGTTLALTSDEITVELACGARPGDEDDEDDDDGGGCATSRGSHSAWLALLAALGLAVRIRTRRRA